jgi:adenine C2-methylase RlmN of 23S rRNA A2503 and tRNA A37
LAHELGKMLEGKLAHVNFIPYNSWEWNIAKSLLSEIIWNKSSANHSYNPTPRIIIEKFQSILQHYWVVSTIRTTMWDDIDAACGQLANKNLQKIK